MKSVFFRGYHVSREGEAYRAENVLTRSSFLVEKSFDENGNCNYAVCDDPKSINGAICYSPLASLHETFDTPAKALYFGMTGITA